MSQIYINATADRLEAIYKQSESPNAPCVLLLHPHPMYDGNMHSKIVFLMEKVFYANGFTTLRFNFRGVGESEGSYDYGFGEIIDASCCCDWLQERNIDSSSFWVSGFSFGAYIAIQTMMRRIEVNRFISIGLPANMFDVSFIYPCPTNGLFVHAEKDNIAPIKDAEKVIKKAIRTKDKNIEYQIIKNSDHFFTNHQNELEKILDKYVKKELEVLKNESK